MTRRPKTPDGISKQFLDLIAVNYYGNQCLMWPFGAGSDGYGLIHLNGRKERVARIVCHIANGPAPDPKMDAAHSCGNGHLGCISRRHLRWATRKENVQDAREHGTISAGERNGHAKLTEQDVIYIRNMRGKKKVTDLANQFGVVTTTISQMQFGSTWALTGGPITPRKRPRVKSSAAQ